MDLVGDAFCIKVSPRDTVYEKTVNVDEDAISCKTWRLLSQDNQATVTQGGGGHEEVISTVALGAWTVVST